MQQIDVHVNCSWYCHTTQDWHITVVPGRAIGLAVARLEAGLGGNVGKAAEEILGKQLMLAGYDKKNSTQIV